MGYRRNLSADRVYYNYAQAVKRKTDTKYAGISLTGNFTCFFKKESHTNPKWSIIKSDNMGDVPFGMTVVPRTGVSFPKKSSGQEFDSKNKNGIEKPSGHNMPFFYEFGKWNDKSATAVNRKHPQGSVSC